MIICIDPRRITDRLFNGPHFGVFEYVSDTIIRCQKTGDCFDTQAISKAWMNGSNVEPLN